MLYNMEYSFNFYVINVGPSEFIIWNICSTFNV